jgi:hypothetical protein
MGHSGLKGKRLTLLPEVVLGKKKTRCIIYITFLQYAQHIVPFHQYGRT